MPIRQKAAKELARSILNPYLKSGFATQGQIDAVADIIVLAVKVDEQAAPDSLAALVKRIQDALGTGEEGDNLVAVARDAHSAELELAALIQAKEEA